MAPSLITREDIKQADCHWVVQEECLQRYLFVKSLLLCRATSWQMATDNIKPLNKKTNMLENCVGKRKATIYKYNKHTELYRLRLQFWTLKLMKYFSKISPGKPLSDLCMDAASTLSDHVLLKTWEHCLSHSNSVQLWVAKMAFCFTLNTHHKVPQPYLLTTRAIHATLTIQKFAMMTTVHMHSPVFHSKTQEWKQQCCVPILSTESRRLNIPNQWASFKLT